MTRQGSPLSVRLASAALLACAACAAPKPPPSEPRPRDDSGLLVPTDQLSFPPFMVVQRLSGKRGTEDVAFECVVQLAQGKLTLTGMTPYSARAFVVEQDGVDVRFEKFMLRDVPFEPVDVLYDIHRLFFRGLPAPQSDGTHELVDHGELVRERWRGGHIVERRFHALETYARLVVIRFNDAPAPVIAPRVRITNMHYGYSLEIENVEQKRLEEGYTLDVEKGALPR